MPHGKTDHEEESSTEPVKDQLTQLAEEAATNLNGWKRALADYENLKQETSKRQTENRWFIRAGLLTDFLPFFDHFKLALDHIPEDQRTANWVVGLGHIRNQADELMKAWGIKEIPTKIGDVLQHDIHEAVDSVVEPERPDNTIVRIVSPGLYLDDQVLRPAKVIVNDLTKEKPSEN